MSTDDKATEFFEDMRWLPPVDTVDDLPTDEAREGHLCFVSSESAVYKFTGGEWTIEMTAD